MDDDKRRAVRRKSQLIQVPADTNNPSAKLIQLTQMVDHETIRGLESLLQQAKAGELVGIAFAAMYKRRGYVVSTTGEAHRNPTFALGMLQILSQKIASSIA